MDARQLFLTSLAGLLLSAVFGVSLARAIVTTEQPTGESEGSAVGGANVLVDVSDCDTDPDASTSDSSGESAETEASPQGDDTDDPAAEGTDDDDASGPSTKTFDDDTLAKPEPPDSVRADDEPELTPQQELCRQLGTLLSPPEDPADAHGQLQQITEQASRLALLSQGDALRLKALDVQMQSLYVRTTRFSQHEDVDRLASRLRAAARRAKAIDQPDAAALGEYWLMISELLEINQSGLAREDRREQARQLLRDYLAHHPAGPATENIRRLLEPVTAHETATDPDTLDQRAEGDSLETAAVEDASEDQADDVDVRTDTGIDADTETSDESAPASPTN